MKRGDVYWVDLNPTVGSEINKKRPCIILSDDVFIQERRTIIVLPLTTKGKTNPPLVLELKVNGKNCRAVCDQIRAIDKSRLAGFIEAISSKSLEEIEESIKIILALS
jgi:mRNA interferase MazF